MRRNRIAMAAVLTALSASLFFCRVAEANGITNGDFAGGLSGWTTSTGAEGAIHVYSTGVGGFSPISEGNSFAALQADTFGSDNYNSAGIAQTFTADPDSWLYFDYSLGSSAADATFTLTVDSYSYSTGNGYLPWRGYSYFLGPAGGTHTLSFLAAATQNYTGGHFGMGSGHVVTLSLDNVRVEAPEPSTTILLGLGAFGVLVVAWRRKTAA
jgi:hypothetical protein